MLVKPNVGCLYGVGTCVVCGTACYEVITLLPSSQPRVHYFFSWSVYLKDCDIWVQYRTVVVNHLFCDVIAIVCYQCLSNCI